MQHLPPVSAGSREPEKRPKPTPLSVRTAIKLMVHGGDDGVPLGLIDAAKAVQLKPATLRRYFDRPTVVSLLRAERRAFIATLIAGNPAALARIRDTAENSMSQVRAIDVLEGMGEEEPYRRGTPESPHVTIRIINQPAAPALPTKVIEHAELEGDDPNDVTVRRLREPRFHDPTDPNDR
jgi:hypothetical protein